MNYKSQRIGFIIGSILFVSGSLIFLISCKRNLSTPTPVGNSDKTITAFVVKAADNPTVLTTDITATITSDSINVIFEKGLDITNLVTTIAFTGKTITPASKTKQNFDTTLNYTVTAQDGSTKTYIVSVSFVSGNKTISTFNFRSADNPALTADITGTIGTDSVNVTVPYGTKLTALIPFITSTGKNITPGSLAQQDFTNPVPYTITATDGSTHIYIVKVTVGPSLIAGTIFAVGYQESSPLLNGYLYAVDAATGQLKWSTEDNSVIFSAPTVSGNLVYCADKGGIISAYDRNSGNIMWSYLTSPNNHIQSNPTVVNGALYVGSADSFFYAVNAATGALNWKTQVGPGSGSPTVSGGLVYFASENLYALNGTTGAVIWEVNPSSDTSASFPGNPAVVNGTVYYGCSDRNMYALDAATGNVKWKYLTGDVIDGSPTVVNGILYTSAGSTLYALDAGTGALKWTYSNGFDISSSPIVANGIIYFGLSEEYLIALDANTGSLKWTYLVPTGIEFSPIYMNGTIVFTRFGNLYSLNATTGALNWTLSTGNFELTDPCAVDTLGNVYHTADSGDQN